MTNKTVIKLPKVPRLTDFSTDIGIDKKIYCEALAAWERVCIAATNDLGSPPEDSDDLEA